MKIFASALYMYFKIKTQLLNTPETLQKIILLIKGI